MKNNLEKYIIDMLSMNKNLSIQSLLSECPFEISQSTFYRVIADMSKRHILVKKKQNLSLNFTRVMDHILFADKLKNTYVNDRISEMSDSVLQKYTASTLESLLVIWGDLLIKHTAQYGNSNERYIYNSHPYLMLGMKDTMKRIHKLTSTYSNKVHFVFGNATPLDIYGSQLIATTGAYTCCNTTSTFLSEGYFLNVIGDFVLQLILPQEINEYFEFLFDNTRSIEEFNVGIFNSIFRMKADYVLTTIIDQKKADTLRKRIRGEMR